MLAAVDGIVGETDAVLRLVLTADYGTVLILVVKKSPKRTPSTRAILMRGASDGRSMLFSIRSICSIASPEPVSYTHLDVYKRQMLERLSL